MTAAAPITSYRHRLAELRVKIKSLAEEARIIRREEMRAKRRRDWAVSKLDENFDSSSEGITRNQQLAAIVGVASVTRASLHEHRTGKVRRASRYAQLAYAYLRGKPYASVEPSRPLRSTSHIEIASISANVANFADRSAKFAGLTAIGQWLDGQPSPAQNADGGVEQLGSSSGS